MDLTRRQFLKWTGVSSLGAVLFAGCTIPDRELWIQSPLEIPEDMVSGVDNWYATLCRQCPSPEGLLVRLIEGRAIKIEGNPDYPTNTGAHSARCEASLQTLYHPDRIQQPLKREAGQLRRLTGLDPWATGLDEVIERLKERQGQGSRVALITQPLRGHLGKIVNRLASDYQLRHYVLAPQDEVVLRQAVQEVFGQDRLPHFDLGKTQFLLNFGADFLGTWVSPVPLARQYGEFRQGENRTRGTFVHVGPRFSMTAASADKWIPLRPGTEGILALGLAFLIIDRQLGNPDPAVVAALTENRGIAALQGFDPQSVAQATGLENFLGKQRAMEQIEELAARFAEAETALALGGGETAAGTNGLDSLRAIYALNYLVGSVGQPGGILLNPDTPLADVPASARITPYSEWVQLAEDLMQGRVDTVLVRGADPVHALANMDFAGALGHAGSVVSFGSFLDETTLAAHVVLPEHTALEDWGDDIPDPGPGHQVIGFQQPAVRPLYDTRSFGDVVLEMAERLGHPQGPSGLTMQKVLQQGVGNLFRLGRGLIKGALTDDEFWRGTLARGVWADPDSRGPQVENIPVLPTQISTPEFAGPPGSGGGNFFLLPFSSPHLLSGENAHLPWLQAAPDPLTTVVWQTWVEINDQVARERGLRLGDEVRISGPEGEINALVYPSPAVSPEAVAVPMGQGYTRKGRYAYKRGANVLAILGKQQVSGTGALAWASNRVTVEPTGTNHGMPRNEGTAGIITEPEEGHIIQITKPE